MQQRRSYRRIMLAGGMLWLVYSQSAAVPDEPPSTTTQPSDGATINGVITFHGEPPPARKLAINKDQKICGHETREFYEARVNSDGRLQDVVVYLDSRELKAPWPPVKDGYVLNQKGCVFDPYISIFPRDPNARLRIVNDDPTLHNIHAYEIVGRAKRGLFNIGQPKGGKPVEQPLKLGKRSHIVELKCDAHDFKIGWIFVADNPYCALVNKDGTYTLSGMPPGKHTIKAWHPYLGTLKKVVEVGQGEVVVAGFEFKQKERKK